MIDTLQNLANGTVLRDLDKVDAVSIKNKAQSFNPHMFDTLDQATPQGRLVRPHPARYTAHPPPQFFSPACTPS